MLREDYCSTVHLMALCSDDYCSSVHLYKFVYDRIANTEADMQTVVVHSSWFRTHVTCHDRCVARVHVHAWEPVDADAHIQTMSNTRTCHRAQVDDVA